MTEVMNKQVDEIVVANDIASNGELASGAAVSMPVGEVLRNMEARRVAWEQGAYKTSNQALYGILAECLAFACELTTNESKARNSMLESFYKERGYQWRMETPLVTRIVRAVFGNLERSRINTYSLVLREAQRCKVAYLDLAQWIEERGGLQSIRLSKSATFVSPKIRVETAKQSFDALPVLAVVKNEALSLLADAEFVGTDCVLLGQQQADGSFVVRALLRSGGAVTAAYAALYAKNKPSLAEERQEVAAANDANGVARAAA